MHQDPHPEHDTPQPPARALEVRQVATSWLKPYDGNAMLHPPEQIERLAASMRRFGFTNPVLALPDGTLVAGHGRQIAAMHIGLETVPCIILEGMTPDEARAYCLADNRLAELGEWDAAALEAELLALGEVDPTLLADAGWSEAEVADLLTETTELEDGTELDSPEAFRCPHCGKTIGEDE